MRAIVSFQTVMGAVGCPLLCLQRTHLPPAGGWQWQGDQLGGHWNGQSVFPSWLTWCLCGSYTMTPLVPLLSPGRNLHSCWAQKGWLVGVWRGLSLVPPHCPLLPGLCSDLICWHLPQTLKEAPPSLWGCREAKTPSKSLSAGQGPKERPRLLEARGWLRNRTTVHSCWLEDGILILTGVYLGPMHLGTLWL